MLWRHARRRLTRQWAAALLTTLALGLAGGTSGGSATLLDALERRRLAVHAPDDLISVAPRRGDALLGIPAETLDALADATPLVTDLCGYARGTALVTAGGRESRRSVEGLTAACTGVLGVRPLLGRLLEAVDEPPGSPAAAVAVAGYAFWRDALGADPAAVGRRLRVESMELTIVGVLPAAFRGLHIDQGADLLVPRRLMPALLGLPGSPPALYAIGRLAPGATLAAADADLRARWPDVWAATVRLPAGAPPPAAAQASSLEIRSAARGLSELRSQFGQAARLFALLSLALLILASISVAGVMAARADARSQEFAVMSAAGASRGHATGSVAAEAVLIGTGAAVIAGVTAAALPPVVARTIWTASVPLALPLAPSPARLLLIGGLTAAAAVVLSLPAMLTAWRAAGRPPGTASTRVTGRGGLVALALQAAATVALVFAACVLGHNVVDLYRIDPGYATGGLWWLPLDRQPGAALPADPDAYADALLDRVRTVSGVRAAALSASFPLMPARTLTALTPAIGPTGAEVPVAQARVSRGFFAAIGVRLLAGGDLEAGVPAEAPAGVVLNRRAAALLFGRQPAIGETLAVGGREARVAGVVADFSPGDLRLTGLPVVFSLMTREPALMRAPALVLRVDGGAPRADDLAEAVRSAGRHLAGTPQPVWNHLAGQLARERVVFGLALLLAIAALLVAGAGLYAALSQAAVRRRRDAAIRLALGATRAQAVWAVVRPVLLASTAGLIVGLPLMWAAGRAGRALLFRIAPFDPRTLAVAGLVLAVSATLAAAVPLSGLWRLAPMRWLNDE